MPRPGQNFGVFAGENPRIGRAVPSITTLNRSAGRRLTISFTVRFCAFVFASSANDGVNIVIMGMCECHVFVSPLLLPTTSTVLGVEQRRQVTSPAGNDQLRVKVPVLVNSEQTVANLSSLSKASGSTCPVFV